MQKAVLHYGTVAVSLATALAAGVLALTTNLPDSNFKAMGVVVATVLGAVALGVKAFDAQIAQDNRDAVADPTSNAPSSPSTEPSDAEVNAALNNGNDEQTGNPPSES